MSDTADCEQRPADDLDPGSPPGPTIESSDGLSPELTTVVRSTALRSPILEPSASAPMPVEDGPSFEWNVDRRSLAIHAAPVIAVAAPFVAVGQVRLGLAAAFCTGAILLMRWIGRRAEFGFGDGFVRYRGGLGWPRGVQEEYDVAWGSSGRRSTATQA
jgi:hypothetical protein